MGMAGGLETVQVAAYDNIGYIFISLWPANLSQDQVLYSANATVELMQESQYMGIMDDKRMQKYVDGIAVHWYYDKTSPAQILTETQKKYPTKFIISTEASIVTLMPNVSKVRLGDWSNGEAYLTDMIQDFTHWVAGWYDWNLALNQEGGPNWVENYVDSSIIVNAENDEFYKQPLFYALGHFSKFIHEDSVRIDIVPNNKNGIRTVAFTTPYNATALVISNERDHNTKVTIADPDRGYITISVPKRSFNTLMYW
ncbi:lysosomal acid glucosylceramidase-like [Schistocerca piceifrons]|uniref:lysosomal acid glucosylceramidase-like n=1 Tax=Schistocerca piceifrons TaxID=274613 RepID=UPI001F5ED6FC|nr:lysosomal acid glucosylceramidase-like [Schistocerca piceifrons]